MRLTILAATSRSLNRNSFISIGRRRRRRRGLGRRSRRPRRGPIMAHLPCEGKDCYPQPPPLLLRGTLGACGDGSTSQRRLPLLATTKFWVLPRRRLRRTSRTPSTTCPKSCIRTEIQMPPKPLKDSNRFRLPTRWWEIPSIVSNMTLLCARGKEAVGRTATALLTADRDLAA